MTKPYSAERASGASEFLAWMAYDEQLPSGILTPVYQSYARFVKQTQGRIVATNPDTYAQTGEAL